jgi:hypothetical protein
LNTDGHGLPLEAEGGSVVLIQLLLPTSARGGGERAVADTRRELAEAFGGLTAYVRTPAEGDWTSPAGVRERDTVVMVEVVAPSFDRGWWRAYATRLAARFGEQAIHVRAMPVELLDPDAA